MCTSRERSTVLGRELYLCTCIWLMGASCIYARAFFVCLRTWRFRQVHSPFALALALVSPMKTTRNCHDPCYSLSLFITNLLHLCFVFQTCWLSLHTFNVAVLCRKTTLLWFWFYDRDTIENSSIVPVFV